MLTRPKPAAATAPTEARSAIVVSEDDPTRVELAALLHASGYVTVAVSRFDDATLLLARRTPSVLVVDLVVDDDEEEALALLRRLSGAETAPPTVVLSPSELEDRVPCSLGVPVLRKPAPSATVLAEIVRCIEGRQRPRRVDSEPAK